MSSQLTENFQRSRTEVVFQSAGGGFKRYTVLEGIYSQICDSISCRNIDFPVLKFTKFYSPGFCERNQKSGRNSSVKTDSSSLACESIGWCYSVLPLASSNMNEFLIFLQAKN